MKTKLIILGVVLFLLGIASGYLTAYMIYTELDLWWWKLTEFISLMTAVILPISGTFLVAYSLIEL